MDSSAYNAFAEIDPRDFQRVLSNLIDNATEAISDKGRVTITISSPSSEIIAISVADDGGGIVPEVLEKLQSGIKVSAGKENGHGIGFAFVREKVTEWGGELSIQSAVNMGTAIRISLPRAKTPSWFVEKIDLIDISRVVVLDDDPSIHQIWDHKLRGAEIETKHFSDPSSLRQWLNDLKDRSKTLFLLDYELIGSRETGIDFARSEGIETESFLVTSRYDERSVQDGCHKSGIRLIPKPLAAFVPIYFSGTGELKSVDVALIDDDELVRLAWELAAHRTGHRLVCYESLEAFLQDCQSISKDIPIYVDLNLGGLQNGEEITKLLSQKGHRKLYVATGEDREEVCHHEWITDIVGKEAPFDALSSRATV